MKMYIELRALMDEVFGEKILLAKFISKQQAAQATIS